MEKRVAHSSHPLLLFFPQIVHDTALRNPLCVCAHVYTTCTPLNPTLIIIRLVIDHTHALSIDPACAVC